MMLTANSLQSRNTSLGFALGEGKTLDEVLGARKEVTEGVFSAGAVATLARRLGVTAADLRGRGRAAEPRGERRRHRGAPHRRLQR